MGAVQYLQRIKKIDALLANKKGDYERLFADAVGMGGFSASDPVQSSKNFQKMPDAVCKYIEIEQEMNELKRERKSIIETLETLPAVDYDLLFKTFVQGYSLKEIARHFDKSYDWAKKRKRTALDLLQSILDNKKE